MRRLVSALAAFVLAAGCAEAPTDSVAPGLAAIQVHAVAPPSLARFGPNLAIEQVRVRVYRVVNDISQTVVQRTVPWNPGSDQLSVTLNIVTDQSQEVLNLDLSYETLTGTVLFVAGGQVTVRAGQSSSTPPVTPFYTGPGNNVAFIAITPDAPIVTVGDTVTFTITAIDSNQAPVASVYTAWSASAGQLNALGVFRAPNTPGSVQVIAQTPNGTADTTTVTVIGQGSGAVSGRVIDAATGGGLAGVQVVIFDASDNPIDTLVTASDGSYASGVLPAGIYRIEATLNGFVTTSLFDANLAGGGATTVATIPLAPDNRGSGSLGGVVRDATTNLPIAGASVELRAGVNAQAGAPLVGTISDSLGFYAFSTVPPGTYTISAAAGGYVTGLRTSVALSGGQAFSEDVVLSPVGGSVARIVLTWGANPTDLDAHFTGPTSTAGTRFHVYYSDQGNATAEPFATLDVDETDGFGPETITLVQQRNGVYRYSVHDYSNSDLNPSSALAASGARVDLYLGGALVHTWFVPNQPGTLWTVFELNGATVTPVNSMTYAVDPSTIPVRRPGAPATDAAVIGRGLTPKE
jgi:hypothetical protein